MIHDGDDAVKSFERHPLDLMQLDPMQMQCPANAGHCIATNRLPRHAAM
jgi:hypothetical protein